MGGNYYFAGIENEFQWENKDKNTGDGSSFISQLKRHGSGLFFLHVSAVRTKYGNGIYWDNDAPEVCTSPVRIQPGFASQVATNLFNARKSLVDIAEDKADLIGYSTHVNVSGDFGIINSSFMKQFGVPLSLLGINPLSCGIGFRDKSSQRKELLVDYVDPEDQNMALLLFYTAALFYSRENNFPLSLSHYYNERLDNLVQDGRDSLIPYGDREIHAQTYLEVAHRVLKPYIGRLATPNEAKILREYVCGKRKLECDAMKRYAGLSFLKKYTDPDSDLDYSLRVNPAVLVDRSRYIKARPLSDPLSLFLSTLLKNNNFSTQDWSEVKTSNPPLELTLENQYVLAEASFKLRNNPEGYYTDLCLSLIQMENLSRELGFSDLNYGNLLQAGLVKEVKDIRFPKDTRNLDIATLVRSIEAGHHAYDPSQDHSTIPGFDEMILKNMEPLGSIRDIWLGSKPEFKSLVYRLLVVSALSLVCAFLSTDSPAVKSREYLNQSCVYQQEESFIKGEEETCQAPQ